MILTWWLECLPSGTRKRRKPALLTPSRRIRRSASFLARRTFCSPGSCRRSKRRGNIGKSGNLGTSFSAASMAMPRPTECSPMVIVWSSAGRIAGVPGDVGEVQRYRTWHIENKGPGGNAVGHYIGRNARIWKPRVFAQCMLYLIFSQLVFRLEIPTSNLIA
jgi:hypothetical protein